jgi:tetratricopeptide (TPR) repeat protein
MRAFAAAAALLVAGTLAAGSQAPDTIDALLARYAEGDVHVIERTVTTEKQFETLRAELGHVGGDGWLHGAMGRWHEDRRRAQAAFMLEFALNGLNRRYEHWLDVLEHARRFVTARPAPPGKDPGEDAFEIAWHKAAVALLFGQRPDYVEDHGLKPLAGRVATSPADGRLVDPWFAHARGMAEEQWMALEPAALETRSVAALSHFEEASPLPESAVRRARVLLELGRPAEAFAALETLNDRLHSIDDGDVTYWSWLFRGRALDRLGRLDEAVEAFEAAHRAVPGTQAPAVALLALELRRDRPARAYEWAEAARRTSDAVTDPWWRYREADFRLFRARAIQLRRMMLP